VIGSAAPVQGDRDDRHASELVAHLQDFAAHLLRVREVGDDERGHAGQREDGLGIVALRRAGEIEGDRDVSSGLQLVPQQFTVQHQGEELGRLQIVRAQRRVAVWPDADDQVLACPRVGANLPGRQPEGSAFPGGDEYLSRLGTPSEELLTRLAALRRNHLAAVADLVKAIQSGRLSQYRGPQFRCLKG
jgi:hypothetical protein